MGQEFFAWRGGVGSSVVELNDDLAVFETPLGDRWEYVAVLALPVDWAFRHIGEADKYGNGRHPGARFGDRIMARAADRMALSTERVVDNEGPQEPADDIGALRGRRRRRPYGSYAHASHGYDAEDATHIENYVSATAGVRKGGRRGLEAYLAAWVTGPASHEAYLDGVGRDSLRALEAEYADMSGARKPTGA